MELIKSDSEDIHNVKKKKELSNDATKNESLFPQKPLISTTVFNIDNNIKCFLSSKLAY